MTTHQRKLNRRDFLRTSTVGVVAGAGSLAGGIASTRAAGADTNPFAYDVARFERTDPKLIAYKVEQKISLETLEARRIKAAPDDTLWVAAGRSGVQLSPSGQVLREVKLPGPVRCIGFGLHGEIHFGLRDHVETLAAKSETTVAGPSLGPKAWITSLVATAAGLYAADAGGRVIHRCDETGKAVATVGKRDKSGSAPGFIIPSPYFDIILHKNGLLWAVNPGRHRVEAYTQEGEFELAWGKPSAAIDGFCGCCNPIRLATLPDGRFVTCEKGLPRVKVYSEDGKFESVVAGAESFGPNATTLEPEGFSETGKAALDATVDKQGRVFILHATAREVLVMTRQTA